MAVAVRFSQFSALSHVAADSWVSVGGLSAQNGTGNANTIIWLSIVGALSRFLA
jgi:hypothetical protein